MKKLILALILLVTISSYSQLTSQDFRFNKLYATKGEIKEVMSDPNTYYIVRYIKEIKGIHILTYSNQNIVGLLSIGDIGPLEKFQSEGSTVSKAKANIYGLRGDDDIPIDATLYMVNKEVAICFEDITLSFYN
jgi:hypothetical protein